MSEWQKVLREGSVDTLEKLAEKFGHDVIDVEALRPAFDAFQVRITPAALEQIKEVGDPIWNQYGHERMGWALSTSDPAAP